MTFLASVSPKNWIAVAVIILAVIFIVQNRATVSITVFFMQFQAPLWVSLGIVLLVGWLAGRFSFRKRK
ncbi:DUF1049 domain-containing protein [Paeniglutamicibacter cryotolerans]|uniref:Putative integral membrane protein n=1 Tax=Paeniglutamicibacter cryotolerans TaxID=670079 RepID=A0A839QRC4_9MICC|nr:DUF1049 domain-containing protein [Paeniglutamicibacter cryotolerans]MBB2994621.1 putative integral membrane protein [Paeniglutamicibacter cryotolerans]